MLFNPKEGRSDVGELKAAELPKKDVAELPADSGEMANLVELPDDSGRDVTVNELPEIIKEYIDDIKAKSEYLETFENTDIASSDLKKLSPEETAERREEFDDCKEQLKRDGEKLHGHPWPKYEQDVYSSNGKLIRKAGSDYDAHHIQPLGLGGKNEARNITPLHAGVHYDKQGVHAPNSPYSRMEKMLGGAE